MSPVREALGGVWKSLVNGRSTDECLSSCGMPSSRRQSPPAPRELARAPQARLICGVPLCEHSPTFTQQASTQAWTTGTSPGWVPSWARLRTQLRLGGQASHGPAWALFRRLHGQGDELVRRLLRLSPPRIRCVCVARSLCSSAVPCSQLTLAMPLRRAGTAKHMVHPRPGAVVRGGPRDCRMAVSLASADQAWGIPIAAPGTGRALEALGRRHHLGRMLRGPQLVVRQCRGEAGSQMERLAATACLRARRPGAQSR